MGWSKILKSAIVHKISSWLGEKHNKQMAFIHGWSDGCGRQVLVVKFTINMKVYNEKNPSAITAILRDSDSAMTATQKYTWVQHCTRIFSQPSKSLHKLFM